MSRALCVTLFLALSLSCRSQGDDAMSMNGTWLPSAAELSGEKLPDEVR